MKEVLIVIIVFLIFAAYYFYNQANTFNKNYLDIMENNKQLENDLKLTQIKKKELNDKLQEIEKAKKDIQTKLTNAQNQISGLGAANLDYKNQLSAAQNEVNVLKKQLADLEIAKVAAVEKVRKDLAEAKALAISKINKSIAKIVEMQKEFSSMMPAAEDVIRNYYSNHRRVENGLIHPSAIEEKRNAVNGITQKMFNLTQKLNKCVYETAKLKKQILPTDHQLFFSKVEGEIMQLGDVTDSFKSNCILGPEYSLCGVEDFSYFQNTKFKVKIVDSVSADKRVAQMQVISNFTPNILYASIDNARIGASLFTGLKLSNTPQSVIIEHLMGDYFLIKSFNSGDTDLGYCGIERLYDERRNVYSALHKIKCLNQEVPMVFKAMFYH